MSNTPRVENYLLKFNSEFVPAEFARNLERELTEKTNEVARLHNLLENMTESRDTMIEDRNLLDNEVARLRDQAKIWHQHYRDEAFNAQKYKCAFIDMEKKVERLRKYVERLEIYSPENEWSYPEWRKLIGSKQEQEDPETLFKLYQFRFAPATDEPANPTEEPDVVNPESSSLVVDQKSDNINEEAA